MNFLSVPLKAQVNGRVLSSDWPGNEIKVKHVLSIPIQSSYKKSLLLPPPALCKIKHDGESDLRIFNTEHESKYCTYSTQSRLWDSGAVAALEDFSHLHSKRHEDSLLNEIKVFAASFFILFISVDLSFPLPSSLSHSYRASKNSSAFLNMKCSYQVLIAGSALNHDSVCYKLL